MAPRRLPAAFQRAFFLLLLLPALPLLAQQRRQLTLEDIWAKPDLFPAQPEGINWLKDGKTYTSLVPTQGGGQDIARFDVTTGQRIGTVVEGSALRSAEGPLDVDDYTFSADEQKLLIATANEPIYRRSSKAEYYIYDLKANALKPLSKGGKQMYATFSPDGERVAFVRQNNMYYVDVKTGVEKQITQDGLVNQRINGALDWVYEEEFEFAVGFAWSPDGAKLAFYTFDESQVPSYAMQKWGKLYPESYVYKYPKAGEANSMVGVNVYDLVSGKTVKLETGTDANQYLPRMKWTQNPNLVAVQRIVAGIQVENDLLRRLGRELQEGLDEELVDFRVAGRDLLVATLHAGPRRRQLQAVECALAGQRRAAVARTRSIFARQVLPSNRHSQRRITPQLLVVVEILVPQGQGEHPLPE